MNKNRKMAPKMDLGSAVMTTCWPLSKDTRRDHAIPFRLPARQVMILSVSTKMFCLFWLPFLLGCWNLVGFYQDVLPFLAAFFVGVLADRMRPCIVGGGGGGLGPTLENRTWSRAA